MTAEIVDPSASSVPADQISWLTHMAIPRRLVCESIDELLLPKNSRNLHNTMVRVTDFARPKRTFDKDDAPRKPLPPQTSAYQSQRESTNPRSEARRLKRKTIREADKECFVCRQMGHLSQDCPKNPKGHTTVGGKICYRCGRIDHSLKECKKAPQKRPQKRKREDSISDSDTETPEQEFLPYAKCYVCQKAGHLAGTCPENDRGIYPDGGGCKLCGIRLIPLILTCRCHRSPEAKMSAKGSDRTWGCGRKKGRRNYRCGRRCVPRKITRGDYQTKDNCCEIWSSQKEAESS